MFCSSLADISGESLFFSVSNESRFFSDFFIVSVNCCSY